MWKVIFDNLSKEKFKKSRCCNSSLCYSLDAIRWKLESFEKEVIRRIFVIFHEEFFVDNFIGFSFI